MSPAPPAGLGSVGPAVLMRDIGYPPLRGDPAHDRVHVRKTAGSRRPEPVRHFVDDEPPGTSGASESHQRHRSPQAGKSATVRRRSDSLP